MKIVAVMSNPPNIVFDHLAIGTCIETNNTNYWSFGQSLICSFTKESNRSFDLGEGGGMEGRKQKLVFWEGRKHHKMHGSTKQTGLGGWTMSSILI